MGRNFIKLQRPEAYFVGEWAGDGEVVRTFCNGAKLGRGMSRAP